jgi:hypothetical protein
VADRPPSLKLQDDTRYELVFLELVTQRGGQPYVYKDDKNFEFWLYRIQDVEGNEWTYFARKNQHAMLQQLVPPGSSFLAWNYGRQNPRTKKYFADMAIEVDGQEYRAEDWENVDTAEAPKRKTPPAAKAAPGSGPPVARASGGAPAATRSAASATRQANGGQQKQAVDEVGMFIESLAFAGRMAQSETVNKVASMMGVEVQWDDVRAWATTIMISRLQKGNVAPLNAKYQYRNLTFLDKPVALSPVVESEGHGMADPESTTEDQGTEEGLGADESIDGANDNDDLEF